MKLSPRHWPDWLFRLVMILLWIIGIISISVFIASNPL
jgi:hypothetical protein